MKGGMTGFDRAIVPLKAVKTLGEGQSARYGVQ